MSQSVDQSSPADADRDRLALRLEALGDAIDLAELSGATVVPIALVRAHTGRPRPAAISRRAGAR